MYARIFFGIDFTDESFAVAMPYAFTLGARPFVDERAIQQTAALEVAPLVAAYVDVVGSSDGLVLFVRHLYLVLASLAGAAVFAGLRDAAGSGRALLAAVAALCIMPCTKPTLSYNTIGGLAFCTAAFVAAIGALRPPGTVALGAAALCLAAAVFAYPPLAIPGAVIVLALSWVRPGYALLPFWIASVAAGIAALLVLASHGVGSVTSAVRFSATLGPPTSAGEKLVAVGLGLLNGPFQAVRGSAHPTRFPFAYHLVSYVAIAAPIVLRSRLREPAVRRLFVLVWLPSMVAGITTALSSSNGFLNATVGLIPAFLLVLGLVRHAVVPVAAIVLLLIAQWCFVYRDDPIPALRQTVAHGPYRGIRTSVEKADFLAVLQADVDRFSEGRGSILFYDGFPAGYLLSGLRPATPTMWMPSSEHLPRFDRTPLVRYYDDPRSLPDVVFELHGIPIRRGVRFAGAVTAGHPVAALLEAAGYRVVAERADYRVLVRPPG